ncbi:MAG TPA: NfeD family protein [Polyangia bacterium]|nr:NfeD family protein [Polyangia bacterium]
MLALLAFGQFAGARADAPPAATGKTFVIEISGEIDLGLAPYVERVLKDAGADDLVILRVNTFGGRIDAAVQIRDALLQSKAKTLAFIDSRAISAGALISLATDTIVMTKGATIGAATPVQLEGGKMAPVEAKVVSYFRKEMKATAEAKGRRGDIAEAMVDSTVEIPGLDGKETTLTLTTAEALKFKVAAYEVASLDELLARLGRPAPSVIRPGINWAERLARFLSDGAISSLLMTLGMLGILIELWAPGHALAGGLGVTCLLLFFFGHYVVHLAGWEEILLFGAGIVLVVVELAFFPGHGAVAVLGILMVIASLVMALINVKSVPFDVTWQLGWVTRALAMVFGSLLGTAVAMYFVSRALPSTRFGKPLILTHANTARAGDGDSLIGKHGVTETALRPSGKANIGGKRVDVITDGGFVDANERVVVVEAQGPRVVVRRA